MTGPAEAAQSDLQGYFEADAHLDSRYGPGRYFYWFLARHVRAGDLLFGELDRSPDTTAYNRSGRLFAITTTSVLIVEYSGASEDSDGDSNHDFGSVSLQIYPRPQMFSLQWANRSLNVRSQRYGNGVEPTRAVSRSIKISTDAWSIELPGDQMREDADLYFERLRRALGVGGLPETTV